MPRLFLLPLFFFQFYSQSFQYFYTHVIHAAGLLIPSLLNRNAFTSATLLVSSKEFDSSTKSLGCLACSEENKNNTFSPTRAASVSCVLMILGVENVRNAGKVVVALHACIQK